MKTKLLIFLLFAATITFAIRNSFFQNEPEAWSEKQLMNPSDLAAIINSASAKKPIILSIGFDSGINGSIIIGPVREKENLGKLRTELSKLPRNADIVIYCGCCPFKNCPNVRPAFKLLNEMGFTNHKLLNLSTNLKTDWINKGFPVDAK